MEPVAGEEIPPLEINSENPVRARRKIHLVLVLTPIPLLERVKLIGKFPRSSFRFLFLEATDRKESLSTTLSQKVIDKATVSGVNGRILILFNNPLRVSSKLLACLEKEYTDTYTLNLATLARRSSLEDPQGPEATVVKDLDTYLSAMDSPDEEEGEVCRKPWNRWYAIAAIVVIVMLLLLWFFGSTMTWVALIVGLVLIVGIWWLVSSGYASYHDRAPAQEH